MTPTDRPTMDVSEVAVMEFAFLEHTHLTFHRPYRADHPWSQCINAPAIRRVVDAAWAAIPPDYALHHVERPKP